MRLDETKLRRELTEVLQRKDRVDKVMDIVIRHLTQNRRRGRPAGTAKFEEFDATIIGLVNHDFRGQPYSAVSSLVRDAVEACWNRMHPTKRQSGIGKNVEAATARIMRRLHGDNAYAIAYPIAQRVRSPATKNGELM